MQFYTEALVNELKNKKKIVAFFLGDWRRTSYYEARHREKDIYLLWIEGMHFGKPICYPCALRDGEELLAFENSTLPISKDNNAELIRRWNETVDSQRIRDEYDVTELERKAFNPLFSQYRKEHLEQAIAKAEAEAAGESAAPAALPETDQNEAPEAPAGQEKAD